MPACQPVHGVSRQAPLEICNANQEAEAQWRELEKTAASRPLRFVHLCSSQGLFAAVHMTSNPGDGMRLYAWPRLKMTTNSQNEDMVAHHEPVRSNPKLQQSHQVHLVFFGSLPLREITVAADKVQRTLEEVAEFFGSSAAVFTPDGKRATSSTALAAATCVAHRRGAATTTSHVLHIVMPASAAQAEQMQPEDEKIQDNTQTWSDGVEEARRWMRESHEREVWRWEQAAHSPTRSANDVPFPMPNFGRPLFTSNKPDDDAPRRLCAPELHALYERLGTWEVPPFALAELLELRRRTRLQLASPPAPLDLGTEEGDEWHRIVRLKETERELWGRFNEYPFPCFEFQVWQGDGTAMNEACNPESFREEMHADTASMVFSTDPAWDMLADNVVHAVPKAEWEANARGRWCSRADRSVEDASQVMAPHKDWVCAVCLDESPGNLIRVICGHVFHKACVRKWLGSRGSCPLCRRRVPQPPPPPMNFELTPWRSLPTQVIARDECTEHQTRILEERKRRGPLSTRQLNARRRKLAKRPHFGGRTPGAQFFAEVLPDERDIGPEAAARAWRKLRVQEADQLARLEAEGALLVIFPVHRKWPVVASPSTRLLRLAARSEKRWAQSCKRWKVRRKALGWVPTDYSDLDGRWQESCAARSSPITWARLLG